MSDPGGEGMDSLLDKVQEAFHHGHSSDSSDETDGDKHKHPEKFHLFGRQKPVHSALGGGKRMNPIKSLPFVIVLFLCFLYRLRLRLTKKNLSNFSLHRTLVHFSCCER